MGGWQPRQNAGVNFTGGAFALPTDLEKGRSDKGTIMNVDHHINASNMEKNMHERMTPDEPWIGF